MKNNTLNRRITSQFFLTEDGYDTLKAIWLKRLSEETLNSSDYLLYAVLRGKDFRKGFTPVTNRTKLDNGQAPHGGYDLAARRISFEPYASIIGPHGEQMVRELLGFKMVATNTPNRTQYRAPYVFDFEYDMSALHAAA